MNFSVDSQILTNIDPDLSTIENTKGIFYWVDIKYNENYSEGDLLCLVFRDKEKLQEDCYRVEPIELYPNDNRVNIPSV